MQILIRVENGCVALSFMGPFNLQELLSHTVNALKYCDIIHSFRIAVDFSHIEDEMLSSHEAIFSIKIRELFLSDYFPDGRALAIALVNSKGVVRYSPAADPFCGSGLQVFVADRLESAITWLASLELPATAEACGRTA